MVVLPLEAQGSPSNNSPYNIRVHKESHMKMFHQNTFINGRCGRSAGVAGALRALRALYGRCGRVKVMIMEWGDHLLSDTIGKKRYLIVQPL